MDKKAPINDPCPAIMGLKSWALDNPAWNEMIIPAVSVMDINILATVPINAPVKNSKNKIVKNKAPEGIGLGR